MPFALQQKLTELRKELRMQLTLVLYLIILACLYAFNGRFALSLIERHFTRETAMQDLLHVSSVV